MNMPSNHMTTRSVVAMLIGSSLGATSSATAGLTWLAGAPDQSNSSIIRLSVNSALKVDDVDVIGADALNPATATIGAATISFSGIDTQGGWALSASLPNIAESTVRSNNDMLFFEVTGQQQVSFWAAGVLGYRDFRITNWNTSEILVNYAYSGETTAFDWSQTLEAGQYVLTFEAASPYEGGATAFDGNMMTFTVPAPGALALVGAVGLVGARRRR